MPAHQQSVKCKVNTALHIQMFSEGMTAFQRSCRPRGKCARVEAAEFPNNSFMTSIMDSGKNSRLSRKLKKRQYTRWCFSAIYAELNEVHIYMRALIMNLTSTMTNCSTDNHMLLNVKYYSTLHVAWGKEKQRNNCHYGNFDTNSSRLYKVTRESKENVDPSLLSWSNIFPCEGAASHSGGCASGGNWLTLADWQLDLPGYKNVLIPSNLLFPSFFFAPFSTSTANRTLITNTNNADLWVSALLSYIGFEKNSSVNALPASLSQFQRV